MRDQHFQELMSNFGQRTLLSDGPGSSSESQDYPTVGAAKPSMQDQLDSQVAFRQFLKQRLSNRKPSSEFIQSIKDRIKIIDAAEGL